MLKIMLNITCLAWAALLHGDLILVYRTDVHFTTFTECMVCRPLQQNLPTLIQLHKSLHYTQNLGITLKICTYTDTITIPFPN